MEENNEQTNNAENPQNQFTKLSDKKNFSTKEQQELLEQLRVDSGKIFADLYSTNSEELYALIDNMTEQYGPALPHTVLTRFVSVLKNFVGLKENKSSKQELYDSYNVFEEEFEDYKYSLNDSVQFLQKQSKEKAKLVQKYSSLIDNTYQDILGLKDEVKKYEKNINFINTNYESLLDQKDIDPDYSLELYSQQLFSAQEELAFKQDDYELKRQEKINLSQEISQSTLQKKVFLQTQQSIDMLSKKVSLKLEELLHEDTTILFSKTQAVKTKFAQIEIDEQDLEERIIEKHNEFVQCKPKLTDMYKQLYTRRTKQKRKYR